MTAAHAFTCRNEARPLAADGTPHTTLRIFANGASAGLVTLRNDTGEAQEFERRLLVAPQLADALRACRMELRQLLEAKHDAKTAAEWPEVVAADAALTAAGVQS